MSLRAFVFRMALRLAMPRTMDIGEKRTKTNALAARYQVTKDVSFEPINIGGVHAEWARKPGTDKRTVIIYLHGGAYCYNSVNSYRAFSGGIALASGIPVLTVEYRLAPEHPYPAALEDVLVVYRELLSQGYEAKNVVLMGDSAGGGLCLAATMFLRDHHEPLPAGLALICPWTDLTMSSDSHVRLAKRDPVLDIGFERLCAQAYAGGNDLKDPYISPGFGTFNGMPPMMIHCGTLEIGADDYVILKEKALAVGIDITLKMWKGMFHNFTVFCENTPEGMKSFLDIMAWIKERLSRASS